MSSTSPSTWPDGLEQLYCDKRTADWLRQVKLHRKYRTWEPDSVLLEPDELWDALGRLNERKRVAVVLRFYEDLPDHEIAEILQCRPAI